MSTVESPQAGEGIAIIGMGGRFPGARTVAELWANLCAGVEAITFFTEEELIADGNDPAVVGLPNYVRARGALGDAAYFDAVFFGHSPGVAELMDPQHRLFLECAWAALEQAGYDSERTRARIGVFAGESMNTYLLSNLFQHIKMVASVESLQASIGNDKDSLTAEVAYKLNLRGPSITVQTASSTSLSAVHVACQSLLNYECDMALAGGVSIHFPETAGYLYQAGGATSPDGHCRAFDADAHGFVNGHGAGVVVLKRLEEALADRDTIVAVIKGSAINNDGSAKVSYMAPSVEAQAEVIALAQTIADVAPETISYIETHGTGTHYGDPIEVAALTQAFRSKTQKKQFCALGTLKPNIGHLDAAAGVAGLIKAALALTHRQLPPSINCTLPNPQIDWAGSPFYVNTELTNWPAGSTPRRAGVSSFGMGGTNVHVVVEEAPPIEPPGPSRPWQLLTISAKTSTALDAATAQLAVHLRQHPDQHFADIAYTLQVGRRSFRHRRALVCQDHTDAATALEAHDPERVFSSSQEPGARHLVFMCTGQGAQYLGMARDLYTSEAVFRTQLDRCAELLGPHLGLDLREVLYPDQRPTTNDQRPTTNDKGTRGQGDKEAGESPISNLQSQDSLETQNSTLNPQNFSSILDQTQYTQPALFAIEYALARQLMAWGVQPNALIGHSIGEYVAACLAGVFSLEDALLLVAARGRLVQSLPGGAMLAVPLAEADLQPLLGPDLAVAAVNGPALSVVSGTAAAVTALEQWASDQGLNCRRLHTSHAFHSPMLDPILEPFRAQVRGIRLQPPRLPFISNVSGTWITSAQATDPAYWVSHLRQPVRFAAGLDTLLQTPATVLLEVGPGQILSTFARQHPARSPQQPVLSTLRHPRDRQNDLAFLLGALGKLWLAGIDIDWEQLYADERRQRIPLPTYPFERQRYWVEPKQPAAPVRSGDARLGKQPDIADWFYLPTWKPTLPLQPALAEPRGWVLFVDRRGVGAALARYLSQRDHQVVVVEVGEHFVRRADDLYSLDPAQPADYQALFRDLQAQGRSLRSVVHLWSLDAQGESLEGAQRLGFDSLLFLAQALGSQQALEAQIDVVSADIQPVTGEERLCPERATLLGPCKVIAQEYAQLSCRSIDVALPAAGDWRAERLIAQLAAELTHSAADLTVAYRDAQRWTQTFEPVRLEPASGATTRLREGGVYMITGGLGGIGLVLAEYLARSAHARLALLGRSALPAREGWGAWLATHAEQDAVSRKIRKVQALEALGGEVLLLGADVADHAQMQAALAQVLERFGALHGVIHAAGAVTKDDFHAIQEVGLAEARLHLRSKLEGAAVLEHALQGQRLDFCLLFSSLTSVLGGLGRAAYTAANIGMDCFVRRHNQLNPQAWTSINWDAWQLGDERDQSIGATLAALALAPAEGVEAFQRILAAGPLAQIVVSTGELAARMQQWLALRSTSAETRAAPAQPTQLYPRPDLPTPYVPPRNETERLVTQLWQEVLGIDRVGVHDNFFDLGGNSLTGIDMIGRLTSMFNRTLPTVSLYESPTVSALAKLLAPDTPEPSRYEGSKSRGKLRRETRRGFATSRDGTSD